MMGIQCGLYAYFLVITQGVQTPLHRSTGGRLDLQGGDGRAGGQACFRQKTSPSPFSSLRQKCRFDPYARRIGPSLRGRRRSADDRAERAGFSPNWEKLSAAAFDAAAAATGTQRLGAPSIWPAHDIAPESAGKPCRLPLAIMVSDELIRNDYKPIANLP